MKLRFHNRKGMSLVELIAVMAISVVVIGAALLALYGGSRDATEGSADFVNHGDAHLLETWFRDNLPTANSAAVGDVETSSSRSPVAGEYRLFFTSDGSFEIEQSGKSVLQVSGIQSVTVSTGNIGANQTFHYTIAAEGGKRAFTLSGGVVLNNVPAAADSGSLAIPKLVTLTSADTKHYINIEKTG